MSKYPGYILSSSVPTKSSVIDFAQSVHDFIFPVVESEKIYLSRRQKELGSLQNKLLEILFAFNKHEDINANEMSKSFFNALDDIKKDLEADANAMLAFDPAAKSLEEILFTYPGFQAVASYRIANVLHKLNIPLVPRIITEWAHSETGIDIHPGATIAVPFMIDHGTGVVIGETAVIGKNVKLYQGVTIGALAVNKYEAATKRHPTIEDNVIVYANSTILGGNTVIGHDSLVGGNCFITQSIPPNSVVYHQPIITVRDKKSFTEPLNWVI